MCDRCRTAVDVTVRAIVDGLSRVEGTPGTQLVCDAIAAAMMVAPNDPAPDYPGARDAVDAVMLDAYETSRMEARAVLAHMIGAFTALKNRIVQESIDHHDTFLPAARWDEAQNGFHIFHVIDGNTATFFQHLEEGESRGNGLARILRNFEIVFGEIHR